MLTSVLPPPTAKISPAPWADDQAYGLLHLTTISDPPEAHFTPMGGMPSMIFSRRLGFSVAVGFCEPSSAVSTYDAIHQVTPFPIHAHRTSAAPVASDKNTVRPDHFARTGN
jgi:hypothetical protein